MSGAGDLLKDILGNVVSMLGTDDSIYVSPPPPNWDEAADPGSGTVSDPYHSIKTGITIMAAGGRTVYLRGGQYIESVEVAGISGTRDRKIVVRPYRHERVTIDCIVPEFLNPTPLAHWKPVDNGGEDEFVWTQPFNGGQAGQVTRGAFLETCQHTRLITYHHLEDLRAANELDPHDGPTGDNHVWVRDPATGDMKATNPKRYRNWVYMGPGIWFDPDCRQVHIRLSHTHNGINSWPDYTGITDPREVKLALSKELSHALFFRHCSHIRFKDLTVRFGGQDTIRLRDCCDIEFDHVNIPSRQQRNQASSRREGNEHNKKIVFQHCEIDGGIPTWLFRSDIKDSYFYVPAEISDATVDQVRENTLGVATAGVLISSGRIHLRSTFTTARSSTGTTRPCSATRCGSTTTGCTTSTTICTYRGRRQHQRGVDLPECDHPMSDCTELRREGPCRTGADLQKPDRHPPTHPRHPAWTRGRQPLPPGPTLQGRRRTRGAVSTCGTTRAWSSTPEQRPMSKGSSP